MSSNACVFENEPRFCKCAFEIESQVGFRDVSGILLLPIRPHPKSRRDYDEDRLDMRIETKKVALMLA